jgi:hypothetical protein
VGVDHWKDKQHELQGDHQIRDSRQGEEIEADYGEMSDLTAGTASASYGSDKNTLPSRRVLSAVIKAQKPLNPNPESENEPSKSVPRSELVEQMGKMFISPAVAAKLLDCWIKHFSTHYPVIHTHRLKDLHSRRTDVLDAFQESILHLVYAISGRLLEAVSMNRLDESSRSNQQQTGDAGEYYPEQHYDAALQNMDAVLDLRDGRSVVYLLLLALYCLRGPKDPGAWTIAGLAVRLCIELGLHKKSTTDEVSMGRELEVRIFWSCYYLDRGISVALGKQSFPARIGRSND